jgi:TIR domain
MAAIGRSVRPVHQGERTSVPLLADTAKGSLRGTAPVLDPTSLTRTEYSVGRRSVLKCFISHSSSDRRWVEISLIPVVKQAGLEPWFGPASIETASDWERSILQGLVTSEWFAVILSSHSIKSRWVKIEVHWALEHRNGRVLPIMIEACNPTELHIGLSLIQHFDARSGASNGMKGLSDVLQKARRSEHETQPFRYLPPPPQESVLIKQIKDEAILARVMEASFDFLIFSATFGPLEPGDVAVVVLGNRSLSVRIDFDPAGITLQELRGAPDAQRNGPRVRDASVDVHRRPRAPSPGGSGTSPRTPDPSRPR